MKKNVMRSLKYAKRSLKYRKVQNDRHQGHLAGREMIGAEHCFFDRTATLRECMIIMGLGRTFHSAASGGNTSMVTFQSRIKFIALNPPNTQFKDMINFLHVGH